MEQFDYLFNPHSVAVIGANDTFGKWGFDLMSCLLESSPGRRVYPVNRNVAEVRGVKCYGDITEIPEPVDFAVIAVPNFQAVSAMGDCVRKGVRGAIVITSGFAEVNEEGAKLQAEMVRIARKGGIRFIGPNTMGHFSMASGFITCPWVENIKRGGMGYISQSGNLGMSTIQSGVEAGVGFSKFVGTGNEADLTLEDYLDYLGQDEETKVIVIYMEGLRKGRRFFELAREITKKKPIVVLKSGRTEAGVKAAKSHTAALSGSDVIYDAMFRQLGVIRVNETGELLSTAATLSNQPIPKGGKLGILTMGGGYGVVATDACRRLGLEIATLSRDTIQKLDSILPPFWSHGNPVDMVGAQFISYRCFRAIMEDENVDAVYLVGSIGPVRMRKDRLNEIPSAAREEIKQMLKDSEEEELRNIDTMVELMDEFQKPIIYCAISSMQVPSYAGVHQKLQDNNIFVHPTPEAGARTLAHLARYGEYRNAR